MAPAAQAEAIGSHRHTADRQALPAAVLGGLMKGRTSPKSVSLVGLKAYLKSVLRPRTAIQRRHAARAGAAGIAHVVYVLISMRYHSHSRANGRAVGPESHRRPSGAAAEGAPRASR